MVDARREAVLIAKDGVFKDRTDEVLRYTRTAQGRTAITFAAGGTFPYGQDRVRLLTRPAVQQLGPDVRLTVNGEVWESATEVCIFGGSWAHIFYRTASGERLKIRPADQIGLLHNATGSAEVADVLSYWRKIVADLGPDDPLHRVYDGMSFVHPESALARYLGGALI